MAMTAEVARPSVPPPVREEPEVRRFQIPDLDHHASWFMARFRKGYPHLNERQAISFLRSIIYSNEFMFLFQEDGVALAQAVGAAALETSPVIWERFCWVKDPEDKDQVEAASWFYKEFAKWGKNQGISILHVENDKTDVPRNLIRDRIGAVHTTEQRYVSLKG
jgi:hypothetical protein